MSLMALGQLATSSIEVRNVSGVIGNARAASNVPDSVKMLAMPAGADGIKNADKAVGIDDIKTQTKQRASME